MIYRCMFSSYMNIFKNNKRTFETMISITLCLLCFIQPTFEIIISIMLCLLCFIQPNKFLNELISLFHRCFLVNFEKLRRPSLQNICERLYLNLLFQKICCSRIYFPTVEELLIKSLIDARNKTGNNCT